MTTSENETLKHIRRVQKLLHAAATNLIERARIHDESKLCEPEASTFEVFTKKLAGCTYGSEEYRRFLKEMQPALDHHYSFNRHHPEHWRNGIKDMTLLDVLEMFIDWKAATERHNDGSILKSIDVNQKRFGFSDELATIFRNTVNELWPPSREEWHCFGCGAGGMQGNFCEMCGAGKKDYQAAATGTERR